VNTVQIAGGAAELIVCGNSGGDQARLCIPTIL
jgi:hypothetical protein